MQVPLALVTKYNRPGPRYTSYPPAPHFRPDIDAEAIVRLLQEDNLQPKLGPLSLYVHLPFCRSLCYYCGCHMMVTHRPEKIAQYLKYLAREIALVARWVAPERQVVQLHWGGGTPTYLAPAQIVGLMEVLRAHFSFADKAELGIEADPRGLTKAHLEAARQAGFNRISFGVQDLDLKVQQAINRIQPYEQVAEVTHWARELGFESISYDLIYGLPHQQVAQFEQTIRRVIALGPDRISLFSYAHVPWKKKHQRLIQEAWLPSPAEKLQLFLRAVELLTTEGGYRYIGMDHFARPEDPLSRALDEGTLQRNFQGYSTHGGTELYAFGISAISQLRDAYVQNVLTLPEYYAALDAERLPVGKAYRLTEEDLLRRHVIMSLMCHFRLDIADVERRFGIAFAEHFADALAQLRALEADGLVVCTPEAITVTEIGRFFIRNVAMTFDAYLSVPSDRPLYSQTV
ncbi:Oxygen-independent coproporphyrinogen III oxidase [bacterium HR18]|jgi:oxygen-independent coproporphyrinogen-3 oxidase|uniref:Coproporphyrinogen-III oxidase n=1 Tax=Rhodothermus marinus TaxID=29549 RepID=A0A7V2F7C0_RHOMR|nr:Oxygen-independent coproporphyrinogen III oxidase [bacterium HR18]